MIKPSLILILFSLVITGCWDMREINQLALVMVVGVDKEKESHDVRVTVEIAKPTSTTSILKSDASSSVWTASSTGKDIFEAIRNLATFSSRRIMWAHNNVIIIGESLAKDDITPIIDFFNRNPELRMRTWIAVAKGNAKDLFEVKTGIENISGLSLSRVFTNTKFNAVSFKADMMDVFSEYLDESRQVIIPVVSLKKRLIEEGEENKQYRKEQIVISGAAIFKNTVLAGWLNEKETRGLNWILQTSSNRLVSVSCLNDSHKKITIELNKIRVKTKSILTDNQPSFTISLTTSGGIAEEDCLKPGIHTAEQLKAIVKESVQRTMKSEVEQAIQKLQKDLKSDVIGLGEVVHRQHKKVWKRTLKENWEQIFPEVKVDVNVHVAIDNTTTFYRPLKVNKPSHEESNENTN